MTVHAEYKTTNQLPPPVPRSESNFSLSSQVGFPLLLNAKFNLRFAARGVIAARELHDHPRCPNEGHAQLEVRQNQHRL